MSKSLDRVDRRILDELQGDARVSNQELAKRVGLSPAPCWRRLRRLEEEGFINGYATLLNGRQWACRFSPTRWSHSRTTTRRRSGNSISWCRTARRSGVPLHERAERLPVTNRRGEHGGLRALHVLARAADQGSPRHEYQLVLRTKKYTTRLPVV